MKRIIHYKIVQKQIIRLKNLENQDMNNNNVEVQVEARKIYLKAI